MAYFNDIKNTPACPKCNRQVDEFGHCSHCDIIINSHCPMCDGYVWINNIPEKNHGEAWCSTSGCGYFYNDFITYEDMCGSEGLTKFKHKVLDNASNILRKAKSILNEEEAKIEYDKAAFLLEAYVVECEESWCDSCPVKEVLGGLCSEKLALG